MSASSCKSLRAEEKSLGNTVPEERNFQVRHLQEDKSARTENVKMQRNTPTNKAGKVCKPQPVLRSASRTLPPPGRSTKATDKAKSTAKNRTDARRSKKNPNAFYHGAIVGSFLGATLSTIITNLIVKTFQNA